VHSSAPTGEGALSASDISPVEIVMSHPGTSGPAPAFSQMRTQTKLILMTALFAASGGAIAQAPPAPATPPQQTAPPAPTQAANCAPTEHSGGTVTPSDGATTGQAREPLGDKLAKSDGVLCPPTGVDPEMRAAPPNTGATTPVIPPPGSPGGDQSIRPK